MNKNKYGKIERVIVGILVIVAVVKILQRVIPTTDYRSKYANSDLPSVSDNTGRGNTYKEYRSMYADREYPSSDISVVVSDFISEKSEGVSLKDSYKGVPSVLYAVDGSAVTWKVVVPKGGWYNLELSYMTVPSRGVAIEGSVLINGKVPFSGAETLDFNRLWEDGSKVTYDNQGNEIRPRQEEVFDWQTVLCRSSMGYEIDPYCFYFSAGENTLTLKIDNEPMVLRSVVLKSVKNTCSYALYRAKMPANDAEAKNITLKVQGEDSSLRSEPSLFARYDRSSATTEPYNIDHTVLNYIGGDMWKTPGEWIQWNISIPKTGYYTISIKGRQNYQRGYVACRTLYIDGKIPFDNMKSIGFPYSDDWKMVTLSDNQEPGKSSPYLFYLSKGQHTIRLEATLGGMSGIISELEDSIYRLNLIYRKILVLTGPTPDTARDYNIDKVYPKTIEAMNLESKRLYRLVDQFVAYTGQKSDKIVPAQTLAIQLEGFYNHPDRIPKAFTTFKDNITSLGSSLLSLGETKLDIDYLLINTPDVPISSVKAGFFKHAAHEMRSFMSSFFVDYSSLGNVYKKGDKNIVTVWLVTGRDQSTILKNMIDDSFTPVSDVKVNVKLVDAGALLSAVVAGKGPNVVLSVASTLPVDYAMRQANEDLTQFSDFSKVVSHFYKSAYRSYEYNGGVYALPETETFNLLFYRKDILSEMGLTVPETWDDLVNMLPTLQGDNLSVGIPYTSIQNPNLSFFYSLVFQNGGKVYNTKGTKTALDSEAGIAAFKLYTNFFNNYGLPTVFDFVSRFRSGEMPIGIADYTTYNTLTVSAPEIKGLWDFAVLPGTVRSDAAGKSYLDRSTNNSGVCCMMIRTKDNVVKQNAWKFMKWWVSADTQLRFGQEIEAILGASARYPTANVAALERLPWNSKELSILKESLGNSVGLREVPGSYYTSRHVTNAVRQIINNKADPRETLIDYARKINEELTKKRQEFGLPTE